jgi:hypothetical protein
MEHKGIRYSVVQTSSPTGWKWIVHLNERRTKTGTAPNRVAAIRFAEMAIAKATNAIKKRELPIAVAQQRTSAGRA